MPVKLPVHSIIQSGSGGLIIDVECYLSNGLPAIVIVGLGNKAIDEAKERIRSAFASSKINFPRKRITINLAPADIPKDSTSLDLPIAISILQASSELKNPLKSSQAAIGELGLDGTVRPVRGIIGKIIAGRDNGIDTFFIPQANIRQASLIPGISLVPVIDIRQLFSILLGTAILTPLVTDEITAETHTENTSLDAPLSMISGQERAKRALEITAAGGHNLFLSGPPGTGKSMLAKALPHLLPPLSSEEMLEVTHLHSLASNNYDELIATRPFRAPHHSASHVALIGGGHTLRPGEISLSHRGILFLDEMPEFNRSTLESLRQPLEDRTITIARAKEVVSYPANFILVATANPCPCGYYGTGKECQCLPTGILRYRQKISGPIMDRFDLYVTSDPVDHTQLLQKPGKKNSDNAIHTRIARARRAQWNRFKSHNALNSSMTNKQIAELLDISPEARTLLDEAGNKLNISARSYMRIIKVAQTIADLEGIAQIGPSHMAEALQYRSQNLGTLE